MTGTTRTITRNTRRRVSSRPNRNAELQSRAHALLGADIDFVPNRRFRDATAEAKILGGHGADDDEPRFAQVPSDLPAHLARLCESTLLTAEAETDLFRRMNYLKFRVHTAWQQLDPDRPNRRALEQAEQDLAEATAIRHRIIQANMRLVISIVKKFVGPQNSFDDLLSDGTMSLMHAVDKFDYSRGFRFSTYAYRAIVRNVYRAVKDRERENSRFTPTPDQAWINAEEQCPPGGMSEQTWNRLRNQLANSLERLDRREQLIIRSRFALGPHRKVRTFQSLGNRLGISKERVRQLEQRAIEKLRILALEQGDW